MNLRLYITGLVSLASIVTGILHIRAEYADARERIYQLKPLTMVLIIVVAMLSAAPIATFYKAAIIFGLILALIGDIFLMLPGRNIVLGMMTFVWTHILYLYAFGSVTAWRIPSIWGVLLLVYGYVMYRLLNPYLRELQIPVYIYGGVMLLMVWQALEMFVQVGEWWALSALLGSLFFMASDSALAINEFRKPFRHSPAVVLGLYYLGQLLIALSLHRPLFALLPGM
jgi:uncharacterized membrane protein YhhN